MSLSKYDSTHETTNLARIARLILDPCTDILREILRREISPSLFSQKVTKQMCSNKKIPINKQQELILFPPQFNTIYNGNYSDFDITLLYSVLRNFCPNIKPPMEGWGKNPKGTDKGVGANIERIRFLRNRYYGHQATIYVFDPEFIGTLQEIVEIITELEKYLKISTRDYVDKVLGIKTCSMDADMQKKYIKRLLVVDELYQRVTELSEKVTEMSGKI